ncbi:MAG: IS701 family transposase, partial [Fimbriimonadaceae bacterium]|nr:IS701 family transposase [Fimbriimonadaceae bacterium]
MTAADLDAWAGEFVAFGDRFADLIARPEPRAEDGRYLRGLLLPVERKNGWQLAEAVGKRIPDATQRLLYHARWSAAAARDRLLGFVIETFGSPEGILVLDETGFLKKGDKPVGVQRQYSGTAGKVEHCQLGVCCGYWTPTARVLVDRALYLPRCWCDDLERRQRAKVPETVEFATKADLAERMVRRVTGAGLPVAWVTADEAYGDCSELRASLDELGRRYVVAVSCATPVWTTRPEVITGPRGGRRLADGAPAWEEARQRLASWPQSAWRTLTVSLGEQGPITSDWAAERVVESRGGRPGRDLQSAALDHDAASQMVAQRLLCGPAIHAWHRADGQAAV